MNLPDPQSCYHYYHCEAGCVSRQICPDNFKFHILSGFCLYPGDVDCNGRPCPEEIDHWGEADL